LGAVEVTTTTIATGTAGTIATATGTAGTIATATGTIATGTIAAIALPAISVLAVGGFWLALYFRNKKKEELINILAE
jgi:hypothetical protein